MPPYYVVQRIDGVGEGGEMRYDTLYHRMDNFALVNQLGQEITRGDLEGKVALVAFFYTGDSVIAPGMSDIFQKIQDTYLRSQADLRLLSVSTDPGRDSAEVLKNYADRFRTNHDMWWFLTGPRDSVLNMAKTDFQLSLEQGDSGRFRSPVVVLLDRRQYVRGYFNVLDSGEVKKCVRDISLLMIEKTRNEK